MNNSVGITYEFGSFRLDTQSRRLIRQGRVVPLTPRMYELLLTLLERKGEVVEKEWLLQTIWQDTIVEESNLTQNIFLLRKALSEAGEDRTIIETIPRRGYRFVADVECLTGSEITVKQPAETHVAIDGRKSKASEVGTLHSRKLQITQVFSALHRRPAAALCILVVAILFTSLFYLNSREQKPRFVDIAFQQFDLEKLTQVGNVNQIALSPDGQNLAYSVRKGEQSSIWVRRLVGATAIPAVTSLDAAVTGLSFSPTGDYLYYSAVAKGIGFGILYRIPALGGPSEKLIERIISPVTFSPDGKQLAFVRWLRDQTESALVIANLDGSDERIIAKRTRPAYFIVRGPAWSPDGKIIVCANATAVGNKTLADLMAVDLVSGEEMSLTNQSWSWIGRVAWLPDGSGMIFICWDEKNPQMVDQLWMLSYPEGTVRRITTELSGYGGISLSGDTRLLVALKSDLVSSLWTVPIDPSSTSQRIFPGLGDLSGQGDLTETSTGKIVYTSQVSGQPDLWVLDRKDGRRWQLTNDDSLEEELVVTTDGQWVYYSSDRGGTSHIWRVEIDGTMGTQITKGDGEDSPSLSPDGQWLYFINLADNSSLWKWPLRGGEAVRVSEGVYGSPSASPDGKLIAAYHRQSPTGPVKLALLSTAGGAPLQLHNLILSSDPLSPLKWSPDSKYITYRVTENEVSNIWGHSLDGVPTRLTHFVDEQIYRFTWSPSERDLLCERGYRINDVVALRSRTNL